MNKLSEGMKMKNAFKIESIKGAYRFKTKSNDYIYIGDPKNNEFRPKIKLNRWGEECFLKLNFDDSKIKKSYKICKFENKKLVIWETKDFNFRFYPLKPKLKIFKNINRDIVGEIFDNEYGGLEFEIVLKRKPLNNKIVFSIETKNLKFYYQPPLTEEFNKKDCEIWTETHIKTKNGNKYIRPKNVVGSYAVYHATRTNIHRSKADAEKYKTGQAFHIYRPKVIDSAGNEMWCDLNIDEMKKLLVITIPQEFLDKAIYPVTIDPTFGYTSAGSSKADIDDIIRGSVFTCSENGNADYIKMYVEDYNGSVGSLHKCAIYKHSDSSLVGVTQEVDSGRWRFGWTQFNFSDPKPSLSASTDYVLVGWADIDCWIRYNSGDTNQGHYQNKTYNSFPDPASFSHNNYKCSIYCSYSLPVNPPTVTTEDATDIGFD